MNMTEENERQERLGRYKRSERRWGTSALIGLAIAVPLLTFNIKKAVDLNNFKDHYSEDISEVHERFKRTLRDYCISAVTGLTIASSAVISAKKSRQYGKLLEDGK